MCIFVFFSITVYHKILNRFPILYTRTLLFISSLSNRLHLLTPNSQSSPPHPPLVTMSLLYVCESVSVSQVRSSVCHLRFHREVISCTICLSLADGLRFLE